MLFYSYAPANFAPASGTKCKSIAFLRYIGTPSIPSPQGTLPLTSPD